MYRTVTRVRKSGDNLIPTDVSNAGRRALMCVLQGEALIDENRRDYVPVESERARERECQEHHHHHRQQEKESIQASTIQEEFLLYSMSNGRGLDARTPYLRKVTAANHRHLEDVSYWRKRAGWYDDDTSMKNYNENAQSHRYGDDDYVDSDSGSFYSSWFGGGGNNMILWNLAGVLIILFSCTAMFCIARAIKRKLGSASNPSKDKDKDRLKSSPSKSRSRSTSRTRSRSRAARRDVESDEGTSYSLMEEEEKRRRDRDRERERRRGESKSRSRSASRVRSSRRSLSRQASSRRESSNVTEPMIV